MQIDLTVAIPTWNRAEILDQSLKEIIEYIKPFGQRIELIVSDNASTDSTNEVILKHVNRNAELNIVHYRQRENTGYFGNFKKVKELAKGKYIWILSDNERIADSLLGKILNIIDDSDNFAYIFLANRGEEEIIETTFEDCFHEFNYKMTLISSCIFNNNKEKDSSVFSEFKSNSFLGFALVLTTFLHSKKAFQIKGESFRSIPGKFSYNLVESWTYDIEQCLKYGKSLGCISDNDYSLFKNNVLKLVLDFHMMNFKIFNKVTGKRTFSFDDAYLKFKEFYGDCENMKLLDSLHRINRTQLFICYILRRGMNKVFRTLGLKLRLPYHR